MLPVLPVLQRSAAVTEVALGLCLKKWHPDKQKDQDSSTSRFQDINEAYQCQCYFFLVSKYINITKYLGICFGALRDGIICSIDIVLRLSI